MWKKLSIYALSLIVTLLVYFSIREGVKDVLVSLLSALSPVLLGGFFAYLLNHLVSFYKKVYMLIKVRRGGINTTLSVISAIVTIVIILSLIVIISIPAINQLLSNGGVVGLIEQIKSAFVELDEILGLSGDISLSSLVSQVDNAVIDDYLSSLLSTIPRTLSTVGISLAIAVTYLFEKDKLTNSLKRFADITFKNPEKIKNGCGCAVVILDGYLVAKIIEGSTTGVVFGLVCGILGVPYSPLLGIVMALLFTVPYVGGYFALIPAFAFSLLVSPITGLIILVFGIVLINVVGTFLSPALFKNKLKITPLTTLVSTVVGGGVFGIWGFILAPPVVATIKAYLSVFVSSRQIANNSQ